MYFVTANIPPAPGAEECVQECSRLSVFETAGLLPWKKRTDHCLREVARSCLWFLLAKRRGVTLGKSPGTCLL